MNTEKMCPNCFRETMSGTRCTACGYDATAKPRNPQALPSFAVLHGQYLLGRVLGSGGFGITYLALDLTTGERKAVKECFMRASVLRGPDGYGVVPTDAHQRAVFSVGLEKYEKEAKILYSLRSNDTIVTVEGYFRENGTAYMVMEYIDGKTLKEICKTSQGTTPFWVANDQLWRICGALKVIHAKDVLHRDLGPDNIMVSPDGRTTLIDFGAARYVTGQETNTLTVIVKNGFAPVEQYSSKGKQGPWTDIYALACTMYYYLSGEKPAEAVMRREKDPVVPLHRIRRDIPPAYARVLERSMSFRAEDRYQSVDELLAALERWAPEWARGKTGGSPQPGTDILKKMSEAFKKLFFSGNRTADKPAIPAPPRPTPPPPPPPKPWRAVGTIKYVRPSSGALVAAQVVVGPMGGWIFPFPQNGVLSMGRDGEKCDAVFKAKYISHLHCVIRYDPRDLSLTLTDCSSTGTFMADGRRLPKQTGVRISFGERFYLAAPDYTVAIVCLEA